MSNLYGKTSRERLNTCHIDLQIIFEHVLPEWDHSVLCGERSKEDQMMAYNLKKSKLKYPDSKHNITKKRSKSMAADVAPYPIDWDDRERFVGFGCYVLGVADVLLKAGVVSHRLRWGGDWGHSDRELTPQSFDDLVHFELVEVIHE